MLSDGAVDLSSAETWLWLAAAAGFVVVWTCLLLLIDRVRGNAPSPGRAALHAAAVAVGIVALELVDALPAEILGPLLLVGLLATALGLNAARIWRKEPDPGPLPRGFRPPLPSERSSSSPESDYYR